MGSIGIQALNNEYSCASKGIPRMATWELCPLFSAEDVVRQKIKSLVSIDTK
jgi:hypothetical protein